MGFANAQPILRANFVVMAGLDPAIHALTQRKQNVDARDIWCEDVLRTFARA
jgi:hypothetical protein